MMYSINRDFHIRVSEQIKIEIAKQYHQSCSWRWRKFQSFWPMWHKKMVANSKLILGSKLAENNILEKNHFVKGSPDTSHIFQVNVGKRRIRHRLTLNLNLQSILSLEIHQSISESLCVGSAYFRHWDFHFWKPGLE